jgi:ferredoxin
MSDVIEPASSARSKCRACREKIEKGELRFGESVPNAFGEGDATHWFHVRCAAERRPEKLAAALESYEGDVPDREALTQVVKDAAANPKLADVRRAEHAPSGRASCQKCHEKIAKDELRVAFEREPTEGQAMATTAYVHLACSAEFFGNVGLAAKLKRTSPELTDDDRAAIDTAIPA